MKQEVNPQIRSKVEAHENQVNSLELAFAEDLRILFQEMQQDMVFELYQDTIEKYREPLENLVANYSLEAYRLGLSLFDSIINPNVTKSFYDENTDIPLDVKFDIIAFAKISSDYIMQTYGKRMLDALMQYYEEGIGIQGITDAIIDEVQDPELKKKYENKVHDSYKRYQVHRIARTEIQSGRNRAINDQMKNYNVQYKQWITMRRRVRPQHIYMDGEVVRTDELFSNGLMYPGDKSGKIQEWINCRCTAIPYMEAIL